MRCPCSLCDSLAHFTYQCPMIIEYRQRQLAQLHQPAGSLIDLTSPLADLHIISPEPEALPTPPWFLDDSFEDLPRNPPNSPAAFPYRDYPSNYHGYPSVLQHMVHDERTLTICSHLSPCFTSRGQSY
jgi:hypothetical protein